MVIFITILPAAFIDIAHVHLSAIGAFSATALFPLSYCKKKYLAKGKEELKASYRRVDPGLRALEEENVRLKKIIASQALELEFKTELLKKKRCPLSESKAMIIKYQGKTNIDNLCQWAEVAKSSLYYTAHPGVRGMKPSTHNIIGDCALADNRLVVDQIRAVLSLDYCVYGYRKMTTELQDMEYRINHKKVYRLMRENHLLCRKRIIVQGKTSPY